MNEFKMVTSYSSNEELETEVSRLLNEGWELAGSITDDGNFFIQPMVKYAFPKPQFPMVMGHCYKCCTNNIPGNYNAFRGPTC